MSFSWFRCETGIVDHRKVTELEVLLGDPSALVYVIRLWCWTQKNAPLGRFSNALRPHLESKGMRWTGEPGVLLSALSKAGFLDAAKRTTEVHDWDEYQSALVKKSSRDAELKRQKRSARRAPRESHASATDANGARTGQDERRRDETRENEPNKTNPTVEPAKTVAEEPSPPPNGGQRSWGLVADDLAQWMRATRAKAGSFTPDRESDVAAIHCWALEWVFKNEPDERVLDQMRRAFFAYLTSPWGIARQATLALWCNESVWLPRWSDERAGRAS